LGDPLVSAGVQEIQGERAAVDHLVLGGADLKLGAQFLLGASTPIHFFCRRKNTPARISLEDQKRLTQQITDAVKSFP
jgi:hypothetical protein